MHAARRAVPALVLALGLSACAAQVVVDSPPEAPPYDGPLLVEVTAPPHDEKADRSGAAGRVVDCDTPITGSSEGEPYGGGLVSRSAIAALESELADYPTRGATSGLREVRREADRVLYTFEVDHRTRQALIVHRGRSVEKGRTGWYVESWARCDWAEMPAELSERLGLQIWTDRSGRRVPTSTVVSSLGPEHCQWQGMTFLNLDGGDLDGGQTYVGQPDEDLYPDYFTVPYAGAADLPVDARDIGYELDGRHLWLAPDQSRAYVGNRQSVQVWPRTIQPLGCA